MYMYNNNIQNQIFIILFLETMHERVHMSAWIPYMLMLTFILINDNNNSRLFTRLFT